MIPLSIPNIGEKERSAVDQAMQEGWVSSAGPGVKAFEQEMARYCGARFGVAVSTGTAALHLALQVAGIGKGDLVLVSNLCFVAAVNAIRYVGAEPVLVDAEPENWQLDMDLVEEYLKKNCEVREEGCYEKESGKRVAGVLAVHVLGTAPDLSRLTHLASTWKLELIEDAAEALGSTWEGKSAGTIGKLGCLSFNGNKIMTTGGGGLVLTNDQRLAEHVRHLANQAKVHGDEYLHDETGYNYRMTNIAAVLGSAQLSRMEEFLALKQVIAEKYDQNFQNLPLTLHPRGPEPNEANCWLYTILVDDARQLEEVLIYSGVQVRKLWVPMNRLPANSDCRYLNKHDHSQRIYERSISLPCSTSLTDEEQNQVIEVVKNWFENR